MSTGSRRCPQVRTAACEFHPLFVFHSAGYSGFMAPQYTPRPSRLPVRYPNQIRLYRLRAGLSQEDLGRALGVGKNTVSAWERGLTCPIAPFLMRLAKALGTLSEELVASVVEERRLALRVAKSRFDAAQRDLEHARTVLSAKHAIASRLLPAMGVRLMEQFSSVQSSNPRPGTTPPEWYTALTRFMRAAPWGARLASTPSLRTRTS